MSNLANLEKMGRLQSQPPAKGEIAGFLENARISIKDSKNPQNSPSTRFRLAYDAGHALALTALRMRGYRPVKGAPGHRSVAFQVLPHSVGADQPITLVLTKANDRRNASEYEGLVNASESEAEDLIAAVEKLERLVVAWLREHRPDLIR